MGKLHIVTATVFNADGETASASYVYDVTTDPVEGAKEFALEAAMERFDEEEYSNACGVIYNVNAVTIPKLPSVTITGEAVAEPVTLEVE